MVVGLAFFPPRRLEGEPSAAGLSAGHTSANGFIPLRLGLTELFRLRFERLFLPRTLGYSINDRRDERGGVIRRESEASHRFRP